MAKSHHAFDGVVIDVFQARTWQMMPANAVMQTVVHQDVVPLVWCNRWYASTRATKGSL